MFYLENKTVTEMHGNCDENDMSGFLLLEEDTGKWRRRFFKLDSEELKLKYYEENPDNSSNPDDCKMLGEVNMKYITKVGACTTRSQVENCFEITTMDETKYTLQTTSPEGLNFWVQAIHNAAKVQVQSRTPDSYCQKTGSLEKSSDNYSGASGDEAEGPVCYETKIIGGVVVRMPVKRSNEGGDEGRSGSGSFGRSNSNNGISTQPGLKPLMDGYCTKQGHVMRNWKRRYFKLDLVKFCYFDKHTDKEPIRSIPASDLTAARRALGSVSTRDNLFEVITPSRTFLIQADNEEQLEQWVKALENVIISIKGRPSPASEVNTRKKKSSKSNIEQEPRIPSLAI